MKNITPLLFLLFVAGQHFKLNAQKPNPFLPMPSKKIDCTGSKDFCKCGLVLLAKDFRSGAIDLKTYNEKITKAREWIAINCNSPIPPDTDTVILGPVVVDTVRKKPAQNASYKVGGNDKIVGVGVYSNFSKRIPIITDAKGHKSWNINFDKTGYTDVVGLAGMERIILPKYLLLAAINGTGNADFNRYLAYGWDTLYLQGPPTREEIFLEDVYSTNIKEGLSPSYLNYIFITGGMTDVLFVRKPCVRLLSGPANVTNPQRFISLDFIRTEGQQHFCFFKPFKPDDYPATRYFIHRNNTKDSLYSIPDYTKPIEGSGSLVLPQPYYNMLFKVGPGADVLGVNIEKEDLPNFLVNLPAPSDADAWYYGGRSIDSFSEESSKLGIKLNFEEIKQCVTANNNLSDIDLIKDALLKVKDNEKLRRLIKYKAKTLNGKWEQRRIIDGNDIYTVYPIVSGDEVALGIFKNEGTKPANRIVTIKENTDVAKALALFKNDGSSMVDMNQVSQMGESIFPFYYKTFLSPTENQSRSLLYASNNDLAFIVQQHGMAQGYFVYKVISLISGINNNYIYTSLSLSPGTSEINIGSYTSGVVNREPFEIEEDEVSDAIKMDIESYAPNSTQIREALKGDLLDELIHKNGAKCCFKFQDGGVYDIKYGYYETSKSTTFYWHVPGSATMNILNVDASTFKRNLEKFCSSQNFLLNQRPIISADIAGEDKFLNRTQFVISVFKEWQTNKSGSKVTPLALFRRN